MSILIAEVPVGQLVIEGDELPAILSSSQQVATLVAVAEQGPAGRDGEGALDLPLSIANGGTGAISAAAARTSLGLTIGTHVQAQDGLLSAIAALATVADRLLYFTGADAVAQTMLTSFMRSLLDDADAATARVTLGAEASSSKGVNNGYAALDSAGKVPTSQLPASVLGDVQYQSSWNAATNTPAIPAAASGNKGWYYVVSTDGSTSIGGITDWKVGDWLISNGGSWDKIDNTDSVTSVAGLAGIISASALKTALTLAKGDVGLGNVDNTSDANKPVSTAQATAIAAKVTQNTWTTYTPTIASSSGAITSSTINRAKYLDVGKVRFYDIDITITNNGTGSGYVSVGLVSSPAQDFNNGIGREIAVSGFPVFAFGFSTNNFVRVVKLLDSSYPGGTNYELSLQFWHAI